MSFEGRVIRNVYNSPTFKIYAVEIDDKKYPNIKKTKYGSVSILGEIHDLAINQVYLIKAEEQYNDKNGYGYKVSNIKMNRPSNVEDMYLFLQEILTENQAKELYKEYPNVVDLVMNDNTQEIDLSKIKGIGEATFEKIKEKIKNNFCLSELVAEFNGAFTFNVIKKLYDKYTSTNMVKKALREDPYKCLCGLAQVGFSTADSLLLELERKMKKFMKDGKEPVITFQYDLKASKQRCLSCLLYLLLKNEEDGNTQMGIIELNKLCKKMVPECSHLFTEAMKCEEIHYDKDKMFVARKVTYNKEVFVANRIKEALNMKQKKLDYVKREKFDKVDGVQLSEEQQNALANICEYNISILNGFAGSGKSFSTQAIINMAEEYYLSYLLIAPTGKAAKVISAYTGKDGQTIHRGLGYTPSEGWGYNSEHTINKDIIILDEASMVDIDVFFHLIDAIDFHRTKLMIIGDDAQLPSVGCGNVLFDLLHSELIPTTTLTKIFRYGEGGLMKVATDVRNGKKYFADTDETVTTFGKNKDYSFINIADEYLLKYMKTLYSKQIESGESPENIQVLTSYRKGDYGSVRVNNLLQPIANKAHYGKGQKVTVGESTYYKGDLVMQTKNNYHARLDVECTESEYRKNPSKYEAFIANGENGVIEDVFMTYVVINFDGIKVRYEKGSMKNVELAYCITFHKSQGGSIKKPFIITPSAHTYMLSSNILYVGLTRAKDKLYHFGMTGTVNKSIKKKANFTRKTNLKWLLQQKRVLTNDEMVV